MAPDVSIIGLGKVGLPMAAGFAAAGVTVSGYDQDPARRALLLDHDPDSAEIRFEKGLSDSLKTGKPNLRPALTLAEAIAASDISFVIVPTPSQPDGSFALDYVIAVFAEIGKALKVKPVAHAVVLVSTVSPGAMTDTLAILLEHHSGLKLGADFHLLYAPALIALGDVIAGFMRPDFAFVGETDPVGGDRLSAFYAAILPDGTPLHRMSAQSVEIAKIALNNFLTLKISFSNIVGSLCDRTPGADALDVLHALGDDHRIGSAYLRPGMPFGGPCLPRDNAALAASLNAAALTAELPDAALAANAGHMVRLAERAEGGPGKTVAVMGLGYKNNSNLTLGSGAIEICNLIAKTGAKVRAFDPLIRDMDLEALDDAVEQFADIAKAVSGCNTVLITHFCAEYGAIKPHIDETVKVIDISGHYKGSISPHQ